MTRKTASALKLAADYQSITMQNHHVSQCYLSDYFRSVFQHIAEFVNFLLIMYCTRVFPRWRTHGVMPPTVCRWSFPSLTKLHTPTTSVIARRVQLRKAAAVIRVYSPSLQKRPFYAVQSCWTELRKCKQYCAFNGAEPGFRDLPTAFFDQF